MDGACALSIESWRLTRIGEKIKDSNEGTGIRHVARHIAETLKKMGIEAVDYTGRIYDHGMVPEIIELRDGKEGLIGNQTVIEETIAPTVTWQGQVVSPGQIILGNSTIVQ